MGTAAKQIDETGNNVDYKLMQKPKSIPKTPGVYIFRNTRKTPVYIGKAANLRSRVSSYFLKTGKSPKTEKLMKEAASVNFLELASELEALITEAELIKKWRPKYNILMRDDKSYFYVAITKEKFPRIFITHQPRNISDSVQKLGAQRQTKISYIGPFTEGGTLTAILRTLRRIFPYCTCKENHTRPCLNSEIGRCPGFCCFDKKYSRHSSTAIPKNHYRESIKNIVAVLEGKRVRLFLELKKNMKAASAGQNFEKAALLRDQLLGLESIFAHRHILKHPSEIEFAQEDLSQKLKELFGTGRAIHRLEGYDISNISGTSAVGSMVVFSKRLPSSPYRYTSHAEYGPDKSQYRKFKIKTVLGPNDVEMLKEVIRRRFGHVEWHFPDILVIDGGRPQLNAVRTVLRELRLKNEDLRSVILTSLAKKEEELYIEGMKHPIRLQEGSGGILHLFQHIRDESHRFAKKYHHKLRKIKYKRD
ncbi:MAG: hypothetical protein A3A28_05325 [Candidatus Sungbacteria bacterium RIFCSPLOWO2_01_FULL_47_32]|uniref:Excinuclease ABC subunit C n=1 Tax=Candidatus Sungbacteria bacterium RIFCSPHIGHO2_01_FULL_47_32 TaxID=1802264 RepID=A0A1G2K3D3_9BACT|nr:MAG: Excinuclease ABC subunit C [Parcubacteria group bacterium GW2011_GWA2_47_10]OGZ93895.1 MAG: hypothetical protein A2633_05265 [Candidatus Sungbacteria bacterium RIFCSPHIGHO2_01_FULL_47_32]OGZ99147.1 MAG: hypothetical protein A3D57_05315 [Candidatus Sungbacteria bacterium RIFCSPHIGHO2_02_FULL_46_12]OHA06023.1 MAG: hypothetical protein A3A28_05325 [Candidatus Sungbacteria bacterium RIFCSPLOWO2_01_FULL_47_32]